MWVLLNMTGSAGGNTALTVVIAPNGVNAYTYTVTLFQPLDHPLTNDPSTPAVETSFEDVTTLFDECRFNDCAHETEPGCAVRAALEDGTLDPVRWESYRKLQRELEHLERRFDKRAQSAARKQWAKLAARHSRGALCVIRASSAPNGSGGTRQTCQPTVPGAAVD